MTDISDTAPANPLSKTRRTATVVLRVLGTVTLATIAVQFLLAGLGAFGASFDPHRMLGNVIGLLALLLLIAALIARPGRSAVVAAVALAVLALVVQGVLARLGDDTDAWFGGLHALNALLIMGLTGRLTAAAGRAAGQGRGSATAESKAAA